MTSLKCPKTRILFKFLDDVRAGAFDNKTSWGFEIRNRQEDINTARWGVVEVVGKDVKAVSVGQYILIEPAMWTLSFTHEGEKLWATAEEKLFAVSDTRPTGTA